MKSTRCNIGRRLVLAATGAFCGVALASSILVGEYDRTTVHVAAGETRTQSEPVVVKPGGVLDKTGEGTLAIPTAMLRDSLTFEMNVRGGTVVFPADAGETAQFPSTPPSVINEKAVIWLDANVKVDVGEVDDGTTGVVAWRDVRETKTATPYDFPRGCYRRAVADKGVGYPSLGGEAGGRKVDFGSYGNGRWMAIVGTNSADSATATLLYDLRHIFVVHEMRDNNCYLLGYENNVAPKSGVAFHPGSSSALMTETILSPASASKASFGGRMERNGLQLDPATDYPKAGLQLQDWHFTGANRKDTTDPYQDAPCGTGAFSAFCAGLFGSDGSRMGGGVICEVIAFKDWLTEAQRIEIAGYLMAKWGIASDAVHGVPHVRAARGAIVSAPIGEVDVGGEGVYAPIATGAEVNEIPTDALANFHGTLSLPYGTAVRTLEELPLEVAAGDTLDVTNSFEGIVLSRRAGLDAGTIAKDNIGGATIHALPAGVTNVHVNGGILRLTPRTWADSIVAGTNTAATVVNGNLEEAGSDQYLVENFRMLATYSRFKWTGGMWPSEDGSYPSHWGKINSHVASMALYHTPDGLYNLVFRGQVYAYGTNIIHESGIYELSFLMMDNSPMEATYKHPVVEVALCDLDGNAIATLAEVQSYQARGWARYRFVTPYIKAGTYLLRVGNTYDTCLGTALYTDVDDVRFTLVSRPATGWTVPNGDFETLVRTNVLPSATTPVAATGWTFTQASWGTDTTLPGASVVRVGSFLSGESASSISAAIEHRYGETQLALVGNSSASVTFKPKRTGVYRLKARVGKWHVGTINGMNTRNSPKLRMDCAQGGGSPATLGTFTAVKRTFVENVWPTDVVFADTNETVVLTLTNTQAESVALVDDLEFVPAHEIREGVSTIVKAAVAFDRASWNFVTNRYPDVSDFARSSAYPATGIGSSVYYGHAQYRGLASGVTIIDSGALYQNVVFPAPGRYRLKWHSRARADVRDANYTASFQYGKASAIRVVLVEDGVTNTLYECATSTTNFIGYACSFDIADAAKTYVLGFEGMNDPRVSGSKDQLSYVCNLVCDHIGEPGQTETALDLDPATSISVASGAKIELDYSGTNDVADVRFAGHRVTGVIDSARFPRYVTGKGALFVRPGVGLSVIIK